MFYRLTSFIAVCELGSVSQAARKLLLTQPAVTQHIRFLEDHFDKKLIKRVGNRMELTPEGERLYLAAKDLLGEVQRLEDVFRAEQETATLRFATVESAVASIVPSAIKRLRRDEMQLRIEPQIAATGRAVQMVLDETVDLALCTMTAFPPGIASEALMEEPLVLIGSVADAKRIASKEWKKRPFIVFPQESVTRAAIDRFFRRARVTPDIVMETMSVSATVSFVEAGVGLSVLPRFAIEHDLRLKRVAKLPIETKAHRSMGIITKRGRKLPLIALNFLQHLRDETRRLQEA